MDIVDTAYESHFVLYRNGTAKILDLKKGAYFALDATDARKAMLMAYKEMQK